MEKGKFEEAKAQAEIIEWCEYIIKNHKEKDEIDLGAFNYLIENKDVKRSFLRWVANEKEIAEKKFNEI